MSNDKKPALMLMTKPNANGMTDGRKTVTRRLVKGDALKWLDVSKFNPDFVGHPENGLSPYGYAGDTVFIKETFWQYGRYEPTGGLTKTGRKKTAFIPYGERGKRVHYGPPSSVAKTKEDMGYHKRSSLFMERWMCRLRPVIVSIKIERLHEVTAASAIAEGIMPYDERLFQNYMLGKDWTYAGENRKGETRLDAVASFASLWDSINGEHVAWDVNPWVWVVGFEAGSLKEIREPRTW